LFQPSLATSGAVKEAKKKIVRKSGEKLHGNCLQLLTNFGSYCK